MKRLSTKAVCSVGAVLAVVFGMNTNLQTSQKGLEHIANLEGCRSQAYQCSANVWTRGIGHAKGVKPGDTVNNQQIAQDFVDDIQAAENVVHSALKQQVTQAQFDVMVSFVFNLGAGNFRRSTLLKKFNRGDTSGACNELLRWVYVNGKDCRKGESQCSGIVRRRRIEHQACLQGW